MKFIIKYKNGYLCIDDDYINVKATANWKETKSPQKTESIGSLRWRIFSWTIYMLVVAVSVWFESAIILLIITAWVGLRLFGYSSSVYQIALLKLYNVERSGKSVILHFYNHAQEPVTEKLRNVSEEDYRVLAQHVI